MKIIKRRPGAGLAETIVGRLRPAIVMMALLLFGAGSGYGQVAWQFSAIKRSDSLVELHVKAVLSEGWHLYPADPTSSPFPTQLSIIQGHGLQNKGKLLEKGRLTDGDGLRYYSGTVEFVQPIVCSADVHNATGAIQFVICTAERCLAPQKKEFMVKW